MSKQDELVNKLFDEAFSMPRDPRSDEYKNGVKSGLRFGLKVYTAKDLCPYKEGTAKADAFFSGLSEGHALAKAHLAAQPESSRG